MAQRIGLLLRIPILIFFLYITVKAVVTSIIANSKVKICFFVLFTNLPEVRNTLPRKCGKEIYYWSSNVILGLLIR